MNPNDMKITKNVYDDISKILRESSLKLIEAEQRKKEELSKILEKSSDGFGYFQLKETSEKKVSNEEYLQERNLMKLVGTAAKVKSQPGRLRRIASHIDRTLNDMDRSDKSGDDEYMEARKKISSGTVTKTGKPTNTKIAAEKRAAIKDMDAAHAKRTSGIMKQRDRAAILRGIAKKKDKKSGTLLQTLRDTIKKARKIRKVANSK